MSAQVSCCCFAVATRAHRKLTSRERKNTGQITNCGRERGGLKKGVRDERVEEKLSRFIAGAFARPSRSGGVPGCGAWGGRQPSIPSGSARCGGSSWHRARSGRGGSEPRELISDAFGRR